MIVENLDYLTFFAPLLLFLLVAVVLAKLVAMSVVGIRNAAEGSIEKKANKILFKFSHDLEMRLRKRYGEKYFYWHDPIIGCATCMPSYHIPFTIVQLVLAYLSASLILNGYILGLELLIPVFLAFIVVPYRWILTIQGLLFAAIFTINLKGVGVPSNIVGQINTVYAIITIAYNTFPFLVGLTSYFSDFDWRDKGFKAANASVSKCAIPQSPTVEESRAANLLKEEKEKASIAPPTISLEQLIKEIVNIKEKDVSLQQLLITLAYADNKQSVIDGISKEQQLQLIQIASDLPKGNVLKKFIKQIWELIQKTMSI